MTRELSNRCGAMIKQTDNLQSLLWRVVRRDQSGHDVNSCLRLVFGVYHYWFILLKLYTLRVARNDVIKIIHNSRLHATVRPRCLHRHQNWHWRSSWWPEYSCYCKHGSFERSANLTNSHIFEFMTQVVSPAGVCLTWSQLPCWRAHHHIDCLNFNHLLNVHSWFLELAWLPWIKTVPFNQEYKMLQNEVHIIKFHYPNAEIRQPRHFFQGTLKNKLQNPKFLTVDKRNLVVIIVLHQNPFAAKLEFWFSLPHSPRFAWGMINACIHSVWCIRDGL